MLFKTGHYLAFEISPISRRALLQAFPPKFERVMCHHITVEFNVYSQSHLDTLCDLIGDQPIFEAVGYSSDDSLECFSVKVHDQGVYKTFRRRPDQNWYHITHSLGNGRKPVESNKLLIANNGIPQIDFDFRPIVLKGELKLLKK